MNSLHGILRTMQIPSSLSLTHRAHHSVSRSPRKSHFCVVETMLPGTGGVILGGTTALLGHELGRQYGPRVASFLIEQGAPLVANGTVSLDCALRALPYLTDRATQMQVGALAFGLAGFAVGAALLWPRE